MKDRSSEARELLVHLTGSEMPWSLTSLTPSSHCLEAVKCQHSVNQTVGTVTSVALLQSVLSLRLSSKIERKGESNWIRCEQGNDEMTWNHRPPFTNRTHTAHSHTFTATLSKSPFLSLCRSGFPLFVSEIWKYFRLLRASFHLTWCGESALFSQVDKRRDEMRGMKGFPGFLPRSEEDFFLDVSGKRHRKQPVVQFHAAKSYLYSTCNLLYKQTGV